MKLTNHPVPVARTCSFCGACNSEVYSVEHEGFSIVYICERCAKLLTRELVHQLIGPESEERSKPLITGLAPKPGVYCDECGELMTTDVAEIYSSKDYACPHCGNQIKGKKRNTVTLCIHTLSDASKQHFTKYLKDKYNLPDKAIVDRSDEHKKWH